MESAPAKRRKWSIGKLIGFAVIAGIGWVLTWELIHAFSCAAYASMKTSATTSLKITGEALLVYTDDYDGHFPTDIKNDAQGWAKLKPYLVMKDERYPVEVSAGEFAMFNSELAGLNVADVENADETIMCWYDLPEEGYWHGDPGYCLSFVSGLTKTGPKLDLTVLISSEED